MGVAVLLSPAATAAWNAAGAKVWRHGPRVIAVRLLVSDPRQRGKQVGILLVSVVASLVSRVLLSCIPFVSPARISTEVPWMFQLWS